MIKWKIFCIGVTFEMRSVLYGNGLLIDNMKMSDRVFISKWDCGEESRIAERERERESVCGWEAAHCRKGEMASIIKWAVRRNTCGKTMCD
jgi:hypothetical protein